MKTEKSNKLHRMSQDIPNTSHSVQSGTNSQQKQGPQSSIPSSKHSSTVNKSSGPGRGWHGDAKGHARAGRQSHKNTGNRHS